MEEYKDIVAQLEKEIKLGVPRQGIVVLALERIAASVQVIGGSKEGDIHFYQALKEGWGDFDFSKYDAVLNKLLSNPSNAIDVYHSYFPFNVRRVIRAYIKKNHKIST